MTASINRLGAFRIGTSAIQEPDFRHHKPLAVQPADEDPQALVGSDAPQTIILNGTAGNDVLVGTAEADTLNGLDGDDLLEGGGGADVLNGGSGFDTVTYAHATSGVRVFISGGGDPGGEALGDIFTSIEGVIGSNFGDYISGNGLNNRLYGGLGDDALFGFGSPGSTSYLYGEAGIDLLIGSEGVDIMDGGEGEDTVSYLLSPVGLTISLSNTAANTGWATGDVYINIQDVIGSEFNDIIYGNSDYINQLQGQSGNDIIYGVAATYTVLIGGAGADQLHGGSGGNLIDYETATSGVTASMADPTINTGDAAGDTYFNLFGRDLAGSPFNDVLYGDAGNNNIIGDPDVTVYLNSGVDQLYGGAGDDTLDGGPKGDVLDGGTGFDAAAYTSALGGVQAYLGASGANTGDAAGDSYVNIEALIGSQFGDVLGGDNLNNSLFGQAGNDILRGEGGDDLLVGGQDGDQLVGGAGFDLAVYSDSGVGLTISMDSPQFNTGIALGDTYDGIEGIMGTAFADTIVGNNEGNTLRGEAGNDVLAGIGGDDTLIGGAGADSLDGGAGYNIASYATAAQGVVASLATPAINTGDAAGDTYANIQQINGSEFGDTLTALNANGSTLRGLGGDDILNAAGFGAQLNGDDGNDVLNGSNADDVLIGGAGADQIRGNGGADLASYVTSFAGVTVSLATGGTGGDAAGDTFSGVENVAGTNFNDTIAGDAAGNYLLGLLGDDTLDGGDGDDLLEGGAGADTLRGGAGFDFATYGGATSGVTASLVGGFEAGEATGDTFVSVEGLLGSAFGDTLTGDANSNVIQGYAGNDIINGGAGIDQLIGGDGDDVIIGGLGNDSLTGGAGADTFTYLSGLESQSTPEIAPDIINDFQSGVDKIDISALTPTNVTITQDGIYTLVSAQSSSGAFAVRVIGSVAITDIIQTATGSQIVGTAGNDTINGTNGNDVIAGGAGNDVLTGGTGSDTFRYLAASDSPGGAGDYITDFQTGSDRIDLTALNTSAISLIRSGATTYLFATTPSGAFQLTIAGVVQGGDILYGNNHSVFIQGNPNANDGELLIGSSQGDPILGYGGNDTLIGGGGADALAGGAGVDTYVYQALTDSNASGYDNLFDFETGVDRIDLSALNTLSISVIRQDGSSFIFGSSANGAFQMIAAGRAINGNDFIYGNNHSVYLVGSSASDVLVGSSQADPIIGGDGDDFIVGGRGADALAGDSGNGSGTGRDVFIYQQVSDSSATDGYDNLFDFQTGLDKIDLTSIGVTSISVQRQDGSTFVFMGTSGGAMQLVAAGRDINGSDFTYNGTFGTYLVGSGGVDTLIGSDRNDPIVAGAGNDIVIGAGGADDLYGGAGADIFRYRAVSDSALANADRIQDFVSGTDKIDLSAIRTGGSDVYGIAYSGGGSFLYVDLGGNGVNDMLIQFTNVTLTAADIIWSASGAPLEYAGKAAAPSTLPTEGEGALAAFADDAFGGGDSGLGLTLNDPLAPTGYHHDQGWWM